MDATNVTEYTNIVSEIVGKTRSDLIFFFVILLVALVLVFIPVYRLKNKRDKDSNASKVDEKKLLIDVINRNSDVIGTLKTTIDSNNLAMTTVLADLENSTKDIGKTVDKISIKQEVTDHKLDGITTTVHDLREKIMHQ